MPSSERSGDHERLEAAVVLAGGRSRRMGTDKAALELGGETLLERLLRGLLGMFDAVGVSLEPGAGARLAAARRPSARALLERVTVYEDARRHAGPLEALRSLLAAMPHERVFVVAVDVPVIWAPLVRLLWARASEPGCRAAIPVWEGRAQPTFAVYARSLLEDLERTRGARSDLRQIAGWEGVASVSLSGSAREPSLGGDPHAAARVFRTVNTPEEYARLRADFQAGLVRRDPVVE